MPDSLHGSGQEPPRPLRVFDAVGGWDALRGRLASRPISPVDLELLDEAVTFAVHWHADQRRPGGEPYVEHLLEVVSVLAEGVGVRDADMLRAAVLHDVVEDTPCTLDDVRDRFGDPVGTLVDWLTKRPPGDGQTAEQARTAYLTRLQEAPPQAVLVKLADRLSNVQRLDTYPRPEKRRRYYTETVRGIVPMAGPYPWFRSWYADWEAAFRHLA
ncbi:MAG: bifunctional (p)ppGpp synthetase/guanosine-3',5'-bis(diphosphate) 3'-pyrophosphohydrolase [Streptomycetaceae bacterium]|nr:bifunctional (p)ppGpp synthetase/guanosine-3',5'-bis(diphosphate) 3'-pyrophosphohydrolase [Streptomycetaceae bacterium]